MMFLDLPEDVRVAICAHISLEDLLVLKQVGALNILLHNQSTTAHDPSI
jgi:hypothetical protein